MVAVPVHHRHTMARELCKRAERWQRMEFARLSRYLGPSAGPPPPPPRPRDYVASPAGGAELQFISDYADAICFLHMTSGFGGYQLMYVG